MLGLLAVNLAYRSSNNIYASCSIRVHKELGPGFAEITYQRALAVELRYSGLEYEVEVPVDLTYRDQVIGQGRIDMLVNRQLVVELKAAAPNAELYRRQVAKYLKATGLTLGLVINFECATLVEGVARVIRTT